MSLREGGLFDAMVCTMYESRLFGMWSFVEAVFGNKVGARTGPF